eukprot:36235-Chlamydomonas_euryale.AAC.5
MRASACSTVLPLLHVFASVMATPRSTLQLAWLCTAASTNGTLETSQALARVRLAVPTLCLDSESCKAHTVATAARLHPTRAL